MFKKTLLSGFLTAVAVGGVLVSCSDETGQFGRDGVGGLNPVVDLNTTVNSSRKASRATDVTVNDLALKISSVDGQFSRTWSSVADYDVTTEFPVGQYVVEATYGSIDNEGFDRPAYAGSTTVTVLENKTTQVSLTATLANSMVSIEYTDEFRDYMKSWSAELHSTGGAYLYYSPEETAPVYLRPGDVSIDLDVVKPNGLGATLRVATFKALPRYHYHITVGLENGTGEAVLKITFDENLTNEEITIDLSDEVLNAPAPVINGTGVENGGTVNYMEGSEPQKITLDIVARGEIASAILNTTSRSLVMQGWPTEVDIVGIADNMLSRMTNLGFVQRGVATDAAKFGVLDFTQVQKSLKVADIDQPNEFQLRVIDKYGKVSEPFTFTMTMTELAMALSNPSELALAATDLDVDFSYNGTDIATNVRFEVQNNLGTWQKVAVRNIGAPNDGVYRVSLTVPATTRAVPLRAYSCGKYSDVLTVNRSGVSDFTIAAPEDDIWTNRADIVLSAGNADATVLAANATVYLSTDGVNYTPATITGVNGAAVTIGGLTSGTSYYAKASVTDNEAQSCDAIRFATEVAAGVPNGDFENLTSAYSVSKMEQGGQWSISAGINYTTTVTYAISEADGWATTNAKTMSSTTANTWFRQPSVFNTSLTYSSTVPSIRFIGTGGGTETPASFTGFAAHSGSNAMVVRNVAWDAAGTVPAVWRKEFASSDDYYNHTVPAVGNHSVGKMFLGSYAYSDGNETYNEGTAFASRPSSLTGWYRYTPDAGDASDNGVVTVKVLNGSTVIATGTAQLGSAADYTPFTVNLNYVANAPKATSVCIEVASSKHSSTIAGETSNVTVTTYNSRYEGYQHGATLVVDDFKFVY